MKFVNIMRTGMAISNFMEQFPNIAALNNSYAYDI
jgi:hypothetical protein